MTPEQALQIFTDAKRAYQFAFGTPAGQAVQADLAPFCRARETCVVIGKPDATLVLEGRREVWLRIQDYLNLTPEQLVERYTRTLNGVTTDA